MEPLFLTWDEVLAQHAEQLRRYGGTSGLRDEGLLRTALAPGSWHRRVSPIIIDIKL